AFVGQSKSLLMEWCLDCHRAPEKYLRPKSEVYSVAWQAPSTQLELGRRLAPEGRGTTSVRCGTSPPCATRVFWTSLSAGGNAPAFREFLHREFPEQASMSEDEKGRREFLTLMGAS